MKEAQPRPVLSLPGASDLPAVVVCHRSTAPTLTGAWRHLRPDYQPATAPCRASCPLGTDIEGFLNLCAESALADAWRLIVENNPLPAVCGRVCFKPCETACSRSRLDEPVAVRDLERAAGDTALGQELPLPGIAEGRAAPVAVVGSGPAGLSCAYHLVRRGYRPTLFEARESAGGLLRHGIPAYRLPERILESELERLFACGIEFRPGIKLGRDLHLSDLHGFAAVFLATGLQAPRSLHLPLPGSDRIVPALRFLEKVRSRRELPVGNRVVVIGGGNAAVDAARSAIRLGARVTLCCLEERSHMPADEDETRHAEREGVRIEDQTAVREVALGEDGRILLAVSRVKSFSLGGERASVEVASGYERLVEATFMVVAAGQGMDGSALAGIIPPRPSDGVAVAPGPAGQLTLLGGDLATALPGKTGPATVAGALASGMLAASAIHRHLGELEPERRAMAQVASEDMNLAYFERAKRERAAELPLADRLRGFGEVRRGLSPEAAAAEARRCFHCGRCTGCDICRTFCPDLAVAPAPREGQYDIDYDHCKGCGICAEECPRGVIQMVEERK